MIDLTRRQLPTRLLVAAVVVAAAGFAAIGATARASSPTTIGSRDTKVDVILVGPRGQTLYLFNRDRGATSSCYGRCAANWPPLRATGRLVAMPGSGVKQRWLSTTRRRDGIVQVTYQGHPLYVNGGDTKPGSLKGANAHEFGGTWYDVPVNGVKSAPV